MDKIIVLLLFISIKLQSQNVFNKHYGIDLGFYSFSSVVELNNKFYVLAHSNSPSLNNRYGTSGIIQCDMDGNILKTDSILPTTSNFYSWPTNLKTLNDSILYYTCLDTSYNHLITYNINSRQFFSTTIKCQLGSKLYLNSYGIISENGSKYLLSNHSVRAKQFGTGLWGIYDLVISKIESNGVIQNKIFSEGNNDIIGFNLLSLSNGRIAIVGLISDYVYESRPDFTFQQFIYILDKDLNLIKKITSPMSKKLYWISNMIEHSEGNLYCASALLKIHYEHPSISYYDNIPAITSYDSSGNYKWTNTYVPKLDNTNSDLYTSLCFDQDSTHIVAAGNYQVLDTLVDDTLLIGYYVSKGLITKIDLKGNLIWNRTYIARGNEMMFNLNDVYDIQKISTGGYLLSGDSDMYDFKERTLHGWLLRIDEEGCLIPGCHLVGLNPKVDKVDIKIYPNPASELLYIMHGYNKALNLKIINIQGQIIKIIRDIHPLETNLVPISNLAKGEYIFYFSDAKREKYFTEKVIIN